MPRFQDLFFGGLDARKGWIGAGFVRFGLGFGVRKTRFGGLTRDFAGKVEGSRGQRFDVGWRSRHKLTRSD
jgi:hypothetical protein